jgi:hypothetical protein
MISAFVLNLFIMVMGWSPAVVVDKMSELKGNFSEIAITSETGCSEIVKFFFDVLATGETLDRASERVHLCEMLLMFSGNDFCTGFRLL